MDFTQDELDEILATIEIAHEANLDWKGIAWNPDLVPIHTSIINKIRGHND